MNVNSLLKTPLEKLSFAVVDTETTGMYPLHNKIMDIGIVIVKNQRITGEWETLINPMQDIPDWITEYTNIQKHHVDHKAPFETHAKELDSLLEGHIFVAHNLEFDFGFLKNEFKRSNIEFNPPRLCTVKLGRKLLPKLSHCNLDALAEFYNIKIEKRHRALPDAKATALILIEFLNISQSKYGAKNFFDLEKLQHIKSKPFEIMEKRHRPKLL